MATLIALITEMAIYVVDHAPTNYLGAQCLLYTQSTLNNYIDGFFKDGYSRKLDEFQARFTEAEKRFQASLQVEAVIGITDIGALQKGPTAPLIRPIQAVVEDARGAVGSALFLCRRSLSSV